MAKNVDIKITTSADAKGLKETEQGLNAIKKTSKEASEEAKRNAKETAEEERKLAKERKEAAEAEKRALAERKQAYREAQAEQKKAAAEKREAEKKARDEAKARADAEKKAQAEFRKTAQEQEKLGKSTRDSGRATLEFSRAFEDAQYGVGGVLNNIPSLIQSLGGPAGLAGAISVTAVIAANVLPKVWAALNDTSDEVQGLERETLKMELADERAKIAKNELIESLRREEEASEKTTQQILADTEKRVKAIDGETSAIQKEQQAQEKVNQIKMNIEIERLKRSGKSNDSILIEEQRIRDRFAKKQRDDAKRFATLEVEQNRKKFDEITSYEVQLKEQNVELFSRLEKLAGEEQLKDIQSRLLDASQQSKRLTGAFRADLKEKGIDSADAAEELFMAPGLANQVRGDLGGLNRIAFDDLVKTGETIARLKEAQLKIEKEVIQRKSLEERLNSLKKAEQEFEERKADLQSKQLEKLKELDFLRQEQFYQEKLDQEKNKSQQSAMREAAKKKADQESQKEQAKAQSRLNESNKTRQQAAEQLGDVVSGMPVSDAFKNRVNLAVGATRDGATQQEIALLTGLLNQVLTELERAKQNEANNATVQQLRQIEARLNTLTNQSKNKRK